MTILFQTKFSPKFKNYRLSSPLLVFNLKKLIRIKSTFQYYHNSLINSL